MKNKLISGWGIKDVAYFTHKTEMVNGRQKIVWTCPYYAKWYGMIQRSYQHKRREINPNRKFGTIAEDWRRFSDFIKWVDSQPNRDWQNCDLDKDLLVSGNTHYSPETVVFVSNKVNSFINDSGKPRGIYMIGVTYVPNLSKKKPYMSRCCNPFNNGKARGQRHIGYYTTELEAHLAWQAKKHEHACQLADLQEDPRVADALRQRYAPDKDWTKQ